MSDHKRQWCAMLAKLTSPMASETAVQSFIAMLPLLPQSDAAFNRTTLEMAARREAGDPAVPNFDTINRAFGRWHRDNLPVQQRMGANPEMPRIEADGPRAPTQAEAAHVAAVLAAYKAIPSAWGGTTLDDNPKIKPNHLHGLALAIARRDAGIPLNPELTTLLAEHERVRA